MTVNDYSARIIKGSFSVKLVIKHIILIRHFITFLDWKSCWKQNFQTLIRVTSVSTLKNVSDNIDHSRTPILAGLVQSSGNLPLVVDILLVWHPFNKLKSNKTISLSQSVQNQTDQRIQGTLTLKYMRSLTSDN